MMLRQAYMACAVGDYIIIVETQSMMIIVIPLLDLDEAIQLSDHPLLPKHATPAYLCGRSEWGFAPPIRFAHEVD